MGPRTLVTHCIAILFGIALALTLDSAAQTSAEVMLNKLAPNDYQGLRNYLLFKASSCSAMALKKRAARQPSS
jgi:hypothetical protein